MRSIDELLAVIKSGDTAEKGEALYKLGFHGDYAKHTIPTLIQMLGDDEWGELAGEALRRIGKSALQPAIDFFKTSQGGGKVNSANVIVSLIYDDCGLFQEDDDEGKCENISGFLHQPGGLDKGLADEISKVTTWAN